MNSHKSRHSHFLRRGGALVAFRALARKVGFGKLLALLALLMASTRVLAQTSMYGNSPEEIKATVKRLKNTVPHFKEQIDKVQHANPYELWQQGQDLKEFGLDTLREIDARKALLEVMEAASTAKFKTEEGNGYLVNKTTKEWVERTKWTNDSSKFVEERDKQKAAGQVDDKDLKGQLDHLIEEVKTARDDLQKSGWVR